MNSSGPIKKNIVLTISYLYILLFVYAAISKLLDFESFKVQIGQSPMLSIYADWISPAVIVIELLIALMLLNRRTKMTALFFSLGLMTMFTAYIFILLHYSSFVPCSCGGVLEKMSWNTHLIFNIAFVSLAALAIILNAKPADSNAAGKRNRTTIKAILGTIVGCILTVVILFLSSEKVMYYDNPFIRRYPQHPAEFRKKINLGYNSFYIAGESDGRIYLANYDYPSYIQSYSALLIDKKEEKILMDPKKIPFKMITTKIQGPFFYLADGSVPIVLRGDLKKWKVDRELKGSPYFTIAQPIDSSSIAVRSNSSKNMQNMLGIFDQHTVPKAKFNRALLHKQVDGVFDTDGILLYSELSGKIVYVHRYRNEFIIADKKGSLIRRGHSIDTISKVKMKVSKLKEGKSYAMATPSYVVNENAAMSGNLLFVNSKVKGRYESDKLWETCFIIDVYDIERNSYLLSFPVFHTASKQLRSIMVNGKYLYAVIGTDLVVYELKSKQIKKYKSKN
ncbi:MauE/DoxX family redox-associated membrane protein [Flavobacterium sp. UGB4466]|uniref:MauE/DoxX family redox-associated membrane protein n=1 Tax=Flavobacterium sp. UGB4466 TaxID=2730889 RepID=UPI00192C63FE|nr:MauE/DoxX family redox-associated membrane protein [Flavobacterium sp. UGB4466]